MAWNWTCPSCGRLTTIVDNNRTFSRAELNSYSKLGEMAALVTSIACPNPECLQLHVHVGIGEAKDFDYVRGSPVAKKFIQKTKIYPEADVLPLPDEIEIPQEIRDTYREAKLVLPISGKASAALSRRCLQGMVRHFFDIPSDKRGNLGAELNFVKDKVDSDVWDDILAVRAVGDIGAHMDKNVDYIIDVHEREAALLVELIEFLFKSWYVERERKSKRSLGLKAMVEDKRNDQRNAKAAAKEGENSNASESPSSKKLPQQK